MNERIKELFEQAHITTTRQAIKGGWYNDRPPYEIVSKTTTEFNPEVFAQLIIKDIVDDLGTLRWSGYDKGWDLAIETVRKDLIKKHFGVEE